MSEKSDDATLSALTVSVGEVIPGFGMNRTSFAVVLPSSVESIRITPTATDAAATVAVDGTAVASGEESPAMPLVAGRNVLPVEVTAADGTTTTRYEVKATRAFAAPNWVKLLDAAPFAARDSAGEVVFNDRMWLLGGYTPAVVSDVWASRDGTAWQQMGSVPSEAGVNIPVTFVHDGRMWVSSNDGRLFASADGREWTLITDQAPWSGRYGAGSAVFNGRMWVAGGHKGGPQNDVWSSVDGVDWTLEVAEAPWSRRQVFSNLVVHRDRLFLVGGGITVYQPFKAYADVWSSPDGREWTKVIDRAPWPERIWTSCAAYRDRIWLLGGFRAQPTWNNFNDVWYSADGADWRQFPSEDIWGPRHEVSAYVHDDALWLVAGNEWPLRNDVWRLDIPGLIFLSQPVLEEFVGTQYSYWARADFNAGGRPVSYRLVEAPPWLSVEADSGLVRGTPPAEGGYPVALEAFDDHGETVRQEYTLDVVR